jgi:hypothetical protein
METWVKTNIDSEKVFIIEPDQSFFYINYERPAFVTWKHSPQNNETIIEWYNRLKLLNKGKDFKSIKDININFKNLSEEEIIAISKSYPNLAYILMPQPTELKFPKLYSTDKYTLFKIVEISNLE